MSKETDKTFLLKPYVKSWRLPKLIVTTPVVGAGAVVGQAQPHPDGGLARVDDGVVVDGAVVAQPHRRVHAVALHVAALEDVDRFCQGAKMDSLKNYRSSCTYHWSKI